MVWTAAGGFSTEPFDFRFYDGTLTQAADPLETSHFGADAVAYRPQILLAFSNLPLANTKFGKIPYVAAVFGDSTGDDVNLGEAFERLAYSPWVGWTSDQYESVNITDGLVHGGLIFSQQAEFLATLQQFARFYPTWDILQTDKLRIKDRGRNLTADITLDATRLMDQVAYTRQEPNTVPRELELTTIDPDMDYTLSPSLAKRPHDPVEVTSSVKVDTAYLPAIMDASTRMAVATYTLYHEVQARKKISLTAMLFGLQIEPGDLIEVTGLGDDFAGETMKVKATTHGINYAVEIQAEALLKCQIGPEVPTTPGATAQWAVSRSRVLVPGYAGAFDTVAAGKAVTWNDQSGFARNLIVSNSGTAPIATTSGPHSRECFDFSPTSFSVGEEMHTQTPAGAIGNLISASTGYMVASIRPDVVTQNSLQSWNNANVLVFGGQFGGLTVKSDGTLLAYNWDGTDDKAASVSGAVPIGGKPCVIEWWHQGGNVYQRVNGGGQTLVASGNTTDLTHEVRMGSSGLGGTFFDGKVYEAMIFSSPPANRDAIVADMMAWVGA